MAYRVGFHCVVCKWTEAIQSVILEAFTQKVETGLKMRVHSHTHMHTHSPTLEDSSVVLITWLK